VTLDPLGVVTKTRTSAQDADNDRLAAAPSTIQQKEELPQLAAESYFYVPGIGDVPEFSLPDFLPDLTGLLLYLLFMAALRSRGGHYIFILWFLFLSFFYLFFLALCQPSHIGCLPYFYTWCALSANLGCRSEMCCMRLAENTGCKKIAKNLPRAYHRTTLSGYIFATKACIDNRKKTC